MLAILPVNLPGLPLYGKPWRSSRQMIAKPILINQFYPIHAILKILGTLSGRGFLAEKTMG
jgi:hypothetical protein